MCNRQGRYFLLIAAGLFTPALLVAQQSTGSFKGRIVESNGKTPAAGVTVTVRHEATNLIRTAVTEVAGTYRFPVLPVGKYRITFSRAGAAYVMEATASLGVEAEINTFRWPSAAGALVVVTAQTEALPVNTNSAETGVNVSAEILEDLPVLTRNVVSAAILAPGVQLIQGANVDPTKKTSLYITNGEGQGRGTNFALDGADNNSTDAGGYVSNVPIDAIAEFQVVTNMYKAEFGRSNAGFFNVLTKSGGNTFSGSLSAQYTDQSLRALRADEPAKPKENDLRTNATVMGPIFKDKLFYMVSMERQDAVAQPYTFTSDTLQVFPALGSTQETTKATTVYAKLDWIVDPAWNLSLSAGYDKNQLAHMAGDYTPGVYGRIDPGMLATSTNKTTRTALKSTVSTGNLAWESILSYFDYSNHITPDPGLVNGTGLMIKAGYVSDDQTQIGRVGTDPDNLQNTGIMRFQWKNDVTYVAGSHNLKAGLDYQHTRVATQYDFFQETGLWVYQTDLPYTLGADLLAQQNAAYWDAHSFGMALVANGTIPGQDYNMYGAYLQDEITLNSNWAVYVGGRVDHDDVFKAIQNWSPLYAQISAMNPAFIAPHAPQDRTYFSPRLQAVWRPKGDDNLVFRVGAGRFTAFSVDQVVGFSRNLSVRNNGIPNGGGIDLLANVGPDDSIGWGYTPVLTIGPGPIFYNDGSPYLINGNQLAPPAQLTPYNYVNNVNNLRTYFNTTVDSWLTAASVTTPGKSLVDPAFHYPTTDQGNIAMTIRWNGAHTLDVNILMTRDKYMTTRYTTDGSGPLAWSPDPSAPGDTSSDMNDSIYRSNQTGRSLQVQAKYTYTAPRMSFLFSVVNRENRSSYGGSSGAFDQGSGPSFMGPGAYINYAAGPERRSQGTERWLGSFAFNYKFPSNTLLGVLGTWHTGKAYDVWQGMYINPNYDPNDPNSRQYPRSTIYNPAPVIGFREGNSAMDLGVRISQEIPLWRGKLDPFIQFSNILNNYDYGANYDGVLNLRDSSSTVEPNPHFGIRGTGWAANNPRMMAFGFRFTF